ncbi:MAG TPA: J domain-containing protein [Candidatus Sericytochromatia bacterium]|jgi:curved DNA-binding protein CbpA
MIEVERYYRILELEPGASLEEVHQGYLDLTWVWHPDRFVGHPRLQQKAHCKLQEINEAHAWLRSFRQTHQKRDLRTKSKSSVSPPPQKPSSAEGLYRSQVPQTENRNDKKTTPSSNPRVTFNTRAVSEWLD